MPLTYGSSEDPQGAILTLVSNGNIRVISIGPNSTITVQPFRSGPTPLEIYSGSDEAAALTVVDNQLKNELA